MQLLESKANSILTGLFRQTVVVSIAINLIQPCNQLIDTILTGHAFGAMALQVYALFLPVNSFIIAASCFFSKGNQITCSHLMGRGRISEAERVMGNALGLGALFSVLVMSLIIAFPGKLAIILGASPDIAGQTGDMSGYLKAYAFGIPAIFVMDIIMCLLQLEGKRNVLVYASLGVLFTNALGDLANIYIFKMGITGMASATSFSNIVVCVFMLIYYVKNAKMLHLSLRSLSVSYTLEIVKNGLPVLTYYGSLVVRNIIMNALILSTLDRGTLVSLLVVNNFATVTDVIIGSWGDAVLLLGGALYGEKDKKGANSLLKLSSVSGAFAMAVLTVLSIIFAVPVSKLFINSQDASYINLSARAVSIASLYLVPDIL